MFAAHAAKFYHFFMIKFKCFLYRFIEKQFLQSVMLVVVVWRRGVTTSSSVKRLPTRSTVRAVVKMSEIRVGSSDRVN